MSEKETDWIHARIPEKMQGSVKKLLEAGYTKTEIAKAGVHYLCKQERSRAKA